MATHSSTSCLENPIGRLLSVGSHFHGIEVDRSLDSCKHIKLLDAKIMNLK